MRRALLLTLVFASGCAVRQPISALPELPKKPHDFSQQVRHFEPIRVAGEPEPVTVSWVEAGEGPPLVLVHGLMTSAYSWRYVISPLAKHYRVIAVDLPGAGHSGAPQRMSQSPQAQGELLLGFFKALGLQRPYLVGNSLGGYVALWFALEHPEAIDRLMIIHAPGFPEPRLYLLHALLGLPFSPGLLKLAAKNPEQFAFDNGHYADPDVRSREETREYSKWTADPQRREVFRRTLEETMDPFVMEKLPAEVAAVRAKGALPPVRLLWARRDVLVSPKFGPRYQALLPEAELVWLDDASHFAQVDAPDATVREIVRFGAQ
jgi:pimeloyl-ACP methyl ester carboxylesterase